MPIALMVFELFISTLLCGAIGLEREWRHKAAGFRTHVLVGLGTTLLTHLSLHAFPGSDPARLASQVVTGVGFIGAGAILQRGHFVRGVTTAATLWVTMSIGMAVGVGWYGLAAFVTAIVLFVLVVFEKIAMRLPERRGLRPIRMHLTVSRAQRTLILELIGEYGGSVRRENWRSDLPEEVSGLSVTFSDVPEARLIALAQRLKAAGVRDLEWFAPEDEEG